MSSSVDGSSTSSSSRGTAILALSVFGLAMLVPLRLVVAPLATDAASWVALTLAGAAAVRFAVIVASGQPRFVELTFWIYVYFWGALAPLAQMSEGRFFWSASYSQVDWLRGMAITTLGAAAWWGSYRLWSRRAARDHPRQLQLQRVVPIGLLGVVTVVAGVAVFGLTSFFQPHGADAAGGLIRLLLTVPATVALYLLWWGRGRGLWRFTRRTRSLALALLAAMVVVANPITNAPLVVAAFALAFAVATGPLTVLRTRVITLLLLSGILLVLPIGDALRHEERGELGFALDRELLLRGDYHAFQQTMDGVDFAASEGHSFGRQLSGPPLFFVPRQVWSQKPEPTGQLVAEWSGYPETNLSSPAWVEGYIDFGWFGVVVVGAVLGMIGATLDGALVRRETGFTASLAPFFAGYQIILLRGSLLGVIGLIAVWVALAWLCSRAGHPTVGTPPRGTELNPPRAAR